MWSHFVVLRKSDLDVQQTHLWVLMQVHENTSMIVVNPEGFLGQLVRPHPLINFVLFAKTDELFEHVDLGIGKIENLD